MSWSSPSRESPRLCGEPGRSLTLSTVDLKTPYRARLHVLRAAGRRIRSETMRIRGRTAGENWLDFLRRSERENSDNRRTDNVHYEFENLVVVLEAS